MIPIVLLPALIIGGWWVIPIVVVVWPLLIADTCTTLHCRLTAGALGAANALVGVGVHQLIRRTWRGRNLVTRSPSNPGR